MIIFETERLAVRRMRADDAGFMLALLNSPSWLRFIGDRGVKTLEDAHRYIETGPLAMYASLGFGSYLVTLKDSGQPIGTCGLLQRDYLDEVDMGYAFQEPYWGQGYAFEVTSGLLDYANTALGLPRVLALVRAENQRSMHLLDKLGLRFDRVITHPDGDRELRVYAVDMANRR